MQLFIAKLANPTVIAAIAVELQYSPDIGVIDKNVPTYFTMATCVLTYTFHFLTAKNQSIPS